MYPSFPEICLVNSNIPKSSIYDNSQMTTKEKRLFVDNVKKILWRYSLNRDNTNVAIYEDEHWEYLEVEVVEITINQPEKEKRIAEIIMGAIPYPMILVLLTEDKAQLWLSHQRHNLNDQEKNVLEGLVSTPWIEQGTVSQVIDLQSCNHSNFYTLYSDMVDAVSIYSAKEELERDFASGEEARAVVAKHQEVTKQIALLRAKLKKETQFNRKMEIGLEIKKLEREYQL